MDQKTGSLDRKLLSIDPAPIEPGRFKPNSLVAISISQETGSIYRKS